MPIACIDRPAACPSGWTAPEAVDASWIADADFLAELAACRAPAVPSAPPSDTSLAMTPVPAPHGWLARVEDLLDRLLPGHLGSLLQLFICVSLTMAMISTMLPLVDRL